MFDRYTEQARRAVFHARYEASQQQEITTAHLLIGLTRDLGSRADAIGHLSKNASHLRSTLGIPALIAKKLGSDLLRDIPLDQNCKMALAHAAQQANMTNDYFIDTDHLLLGLLCFPNDASSALQSISLDLTSVQAASKAHRAKYPDGKTLYHRLFGSPIRAHRILFIKLAIAIAVMLAATLVIRWLNY